LDAGAKIEGKPLYQLLAERYGDDKPNRKVFVYAAGGYYWPGQSIEGHRIRSQGRPVCRDEGPGGVTSSVAQSL